MGTSLAFTSDFIPEPRTELEKENTDRSIFLQGKGETIINNSHPSFESDGGAGFYRFPAWAGTKPNDVSPGHAVCGPSKMLTFPANGRPYLFPSSFGYPGNPKTWVTG